ncbi:peptidoglycan recognition protein family protein [Parasulfitobacter algicola]|uniref:N-acetylmuramoyl-L-alanine amidase n=1 Tax=Parasulfitobacter algicola TaxID=2614809 RepID=A0ABX2IMH5_9RHOB|nr:peptidoglycan recognition family protein [Sulfitobacter algicola]NSX54091.1 N-acetylmuramoyl-L-alanine amidase [Sulfitobacter algicola]
MWKRRSILIGGLSVAATAGVSLGLISRWQYLVIHHSAGRFGDEAALKDIHRQRQPNDPIDMVPYHFLIGNGNGIGLGKVVETERWKRGVWGAHMSSNNLDRNVRGIGVCLIGNFHIGKLDDTQFNAAVMLCRTLMQEHDIILENVSLHGDTRGEASLCPGQHFPKDHFFQALKMA